MRCPRSAALLAAVFTVASHVLLGQSQPAPAAVPQRYALLIGIGKYEHTADEMQLPKDTVAVGRFGPQAVFYDLAGPTSDVDHIRALLAGYIPDPTHILIRKDEQATRANILADLRHTLLELPHPGDTVVLYISSHGSLRYNPDTLVTERFQVNGFKNPVALENTIVPYDWYQGKDDIFSRDLRHLFNQAADHQVHVIAIFDSCYSGSLSRAVRPPGVVDRDLPYDPRPLPPDPDPLGPVPWEREDYPVLVLSAAQKDQSAVDIKSPPHGLFTDALIETLRLFPTNRSVSEVFERLKIAMELQPDSTGQQPELAASADRASLTIFGDPVSSSPITTTVVSIDGDVAVLDIGPAGDIGPGSIFTQVGKADGMAAIVTVAAPITIARSSATVSLARNGTLHPLDQVELSKWVPAQHPSVSFYVASSSPSATELTAAMQAIKAARLQLVSDPTLKPWTHHLAWDGAQWIATPHSQAVIIGVPMKQVKPISLGTHMSPSSFKKLPPQAVVWFDIPLPQELIASILSLPSATVGNALLTPTRGQALYVLGGLSDGNSARYAWLKRDDLDAERQTPPSMGPGCSASSNYPLRTDWTTSSDSKLLPRDLSDKAVQLSRLNDWLQIAHSAVAGQSDFPYHLALRRIFDNTTVSNGGTTYEGQQAYLLELAGNPHGNVTPRSVYVLDIDCQGTGKLLWPYGEMLPGMYPKNGSLASHITLDGDPFNVGKPLGIETYVLLTTSSPLSRPKALEFKGVVSRTTSTVAPTDPLEDLLDAASAGFRIATDRAVPATWGVQTLTVTSLPATSDLPKTDSTPTAAPKP